MTTPMNVYKELAIQYGDIDPEDSEAVNHFFETDVYKLSEETRQTIIDALFSRMDESPNSESIYLSVVAILVWPASSRTCSRGRDLTSSDMPVCLNQ